MIYPVLGFLEFTLASGALYFIILVCGSVIPVSGDDPPDGIGLYVRSNGVHTDLIMDTRSEFYDWSTFIPTEHFPNNKTHKYVAIGWGDKGFFLDTPTWADLSVKTAINAAVFPSSTAMHVEYLDDAPNVDDRCKLKIIERSRYKDLVEFICDTFTKDKDEIILIPNRGYWNNDNFYEANGKYHMFHTCNIWTNEALKVAGVRTALYALTSDGIMRHL